MRTRKYWRFPIALLGCILFGVGAWGALSASGLMPYLAQPFPLTVHVNIVLGAVIYGLAFVAALALVVALAILARRFFLAVFRSAA